MDFAQLPVLDILEEASIGLAVLDRQERYLFCTAAYSRRLRAEPEALLGKPLADFMDAGIYRRHIQPALQRCYAGEIVSYQIIRRIEHTDRVLAVRYIPCRDDSGAVSAVVNIGLDITNDCSLVKDPLADAYWGDRVVSATGTMYVDPDEIQARLARTDRLATLGRATAMLNHELRNPLGTLSANLITLRAQLPDTPAVQKIYARCQRAMSRCERVISSLLDYTRPFPIHTHWHDLDQWLGSFLDDYRVPATVSVQWRPGAAGSLWMDEELMRRVLNNLLDNAIKALQNQPVEARRELCIETDQQGDRVSVIVTDTGPGLPDVLLGSIAPEAQHSGSQTTGFGLLIARQIVARHGGQLSLANVAAGGTRATVSLPRRASPQTEETHAG